MIGDRLLQIARDLTLTGIGTEAYKVAADSISLSQLRDAGRGQPLYMAITVKETVVSSAANRNTSIQLALRTNYRDPVGAFPTGYEINKLNPVVAATSFLMLKSGTGASLLTVGKKIMVPINPHAFTETGLGGVGDVSFTARGITNVYFAWEEHSTADVLTGYLPVAGSTITAGKIDVDIVMLASAGGNASSSEEAIYPATFVVK